MTEYFYSVAKPYYRKKKKKKNAGIVFSKTKTKQIFGVNNIVLVTIDSSKGIF